MGDYFDTKGDGTHSWDTGGSGRRPLSRVDEENAKLRAERDSLLLQNEVLQKEKEVSGTLRLEYKAERDAALRLNGEMKAVLEKIRSYATLANAESEVASLIDTVLPRCEVPEQFGPNYRWRPCGRPLPCVMHKTEKRFCECPGQTGAVSVNGCCVGCKLPIKFPPQKCTRDTDGDGNCWVHPQGCPK